MTGHVAQHLCDQTVLEMVPPEGLSVRPHALPGPCCPGDSAMTSVPSATGAYHDFAITRSRVMSLVSAPWRTALRYSALISAGSRPLSAPHVK